jgi:hypothetical protein
VEAAGFGAEASRLCEVGGYQDLAGLGDLDGPAPAYDGPGNNRASRTGGWRHVPLGGRASVLPAGEAVLEEIEVTCVASGLVDHVDEDPPEVDRADPERWNHCDVVE